MRKTSFLVVATIAASAIVASRARTARADLCDAGGCPANEYCALADGGLDTTDGGVCKPEPCIVSNDCTNGHLCDTSTEPHACVQCISTANCPGNKVCDIATRTCVPPSQVDAGVDAGADADAGGEVDAAPAEDASVPDAATADASVDAPADSSAKDGGSPVTPSAAADAGPDMGALSGGACTCDAVGQASGAGGAIACALFAGAFAIRRRRRRR